jgi:hypothetical protein
MATDTAERPGPDEQYLAATNTSDLTLNLHGNCAATHLIAAALAGNRMGSALLHLKAEWDSADKPRKATEADILARAKALPLNKGKLDLRRARVEAMVNHATAMRARASRLAGRPAVLGMLKEWAESRGMDVDMLSPALYHWLSPACPACEGRGKMRFQDAPILSDRKCVHCTGTGTWPRPLGAEAIHDYFKSCTNKARSERTTLLREK